MTLKEYHFDCGNSFSGPVGFCARIKATSKIEALAILRGAIEENYEFSLDISGPGIVYANCYLNPEFIRETDIDEWE